MSGIEIVAGGIEVELQRRLPGQRKTQRGKLALLVATMLSERSANRRGPRSGGARSGVA